MSGDWKLVEYDVSQKAVGPDVLRSLINGDTGVAVLKGLIDEGELSQSRERLKTLQDETRVTRYVNGSLTLIGTFLVKHLNSLPNYFEAARDADARLDSVGFHLTEKVRDRLREVLGLDSFEVATEDEGRRYASCNIRICAKDIDTPLHNDNIMRDGIGHETVLANLKHQLSCVVCLQGTESGGELSIFSKPWEHADEEFKIPGGLGYHQAVVADREEIRYQPRTGDVYLLNPTNYHAVKHVYGEDRMTLGFFFGFFDDELRSGVTWV